MHDNQHTLRGRIWNDVVALFWIWEYAAQTVFKGCQCWCCSSRFVSSAWLLWLTGPASSHDRAVVCGLSGKHLEKGACGCKCWCVCFDAASLTNLRLLGLHQRLCANNCGVGKAQGRMWCAVPCCGCRCCSTRSARRTHAIRRWSGWTTSCSWRPSARGALVSCTRAAGRAAWLQSRCACGTGGDVWLLPLFSLVGHHDGGDGDVCQTL